jgi:uncharacterized protein (UPF0332 family)
VTTLRDAELHLAKAEEFLTAAESNFGIGLFNAAASDAVVSGINSKDAVCLKLTGRSDRSDDHHSAVAEMQKAGRTAAALASALERLLRLKSKSQYQTVSVSRQDAGNAVDRARALFEGAMAIVHS